MLTMNFDFTNILHTVNLKKLCIIDIDNMFSSCNMRKIFQGMYHLELKLITKTSEMQFKENTLKTWKD